MSIYRRKLMMAYAANLGRGDIVYPGLIAAWSAKGKSNDDEDRAILKDLTGNGHDITLNGFAFNTEGSGYGHLNYPDALVFDGVDDYGINETFPSLDDYTLILNVKRLMNDNYRTFISKSKNGNEGGFMIRTDAVFSYGHVVDYRSVGLEYYTQYFTPTNCNGNKRTRGNNEDPIGLVIGRSRTNNDLGNINMAFYSAYLFDRSLDEQEIKSFIRKYIDPEYLLPSEKARMIKTYEEKTGNKYTKEVS